MKGKYSIAAWTHGFDEDADSPYVEVDFPSTEEVATICSWLESEIRSRNGYEIVATGSCAKGPQGINWEIRVTFEVEADAAQLRDVLQAQFGDPRVRPSEYRTGPQP